MKKALKRFIKPGIITAFPLSIFRTAIRAVSSGVIIDSLTYELCPLIRLVTSELVMIGPGLRTLTLTCVPFSSAPRPLEK